jgi:hypothetical protein
MFCAFEGEPLILRLYGTAKVVHPRDSVWAELAALFPQIPGARQIYDLEVDLVQTSCGLAVPFFDLNEPRDSLEQWADRKGDEGLQEYWEGRNQVSIDGKPTQIIVEEPATT